MYYVNNENELFTELSKLIKKDDLNFEDKETIKRSLQHNSIYKYIVNDQFKSNEETVFKILDLIIKEIKPFNNNLDTYIINNEYAILELLKQGRNFNEIISCEISKDLNNCLNEVVIVTGNILLKYYTKTLKYKNREIKLSYLIQNDLNSRNKNNMFEININICNYDNNMNYLEYHRSKEYYIDELQFIDTFIINFKINHVISDYDLATKYAEEVYNIEKNLSNGNMYTIYHKTINDPFFHNSYVFESIKTFLENFKNDYNNSYKPRFNCGADQCITKLDIANNGEKLFISVNITAKCLTNA